MVAICHIKMTIDLLDCLDVLFVLTFSYGLNLVSLVYFFVKKFRVGFYDSGPFPH